MCTTIKKCSQIDTNSAFHRTIIQAGLKDTTEQPHTYPVLIQTAPFGTNVVSKSESHVECVAPAVDGAKDVNVPMDVVVQVLGVSTKVGTYMYQAPLIESKYNFKNLFVLFFGY